MTFVKALKDTLNFEFQLGKKFYFEAGGMILLDEITESSGKFNFEKSKFNGIISNAFEPYLSVYVDAEDKRIQELLTQYKTQKNDEDESILVLSSSADLFFFYRQSLQNCHQLSNRKPLLDLFKVFCKYLQQYCEFLSSQLPSEVELRKSNSSKELRIICIILNTAEYCSTTIDQVNYALLVA